MAKHTATLATLATLATPALDTDAAYRAAWGFSLEAWHALSDADRRFYRWNVTKATTVVAR